MLYYNICANTEDREMQIINEKEKIAKLEIQKNNGQGTGGNFEFISVIYIYLYITL